MHLHIFVYTRKYNSPQMFHFSFDVNRTVQNEIFPEYFVNLRDFWDMKDSL